SRQLERPHGSSAAAISDWMYASNQAMIEQTIRQLGLDMNQRVLEIGFGSIRHLDFFFQQAPALQYLGFERSQKMICLAKEYVSNKLNQHEISLEKIEKHQDSLINSLRNHGTFDRCFSVNSAYFWPKLDETFLAIKMALKNKGGQFNLTLFEKDYAETLPFR